MLFPLVALLVHCLGAAALLPATGSTPAPEPPLALVGGAVIVRAGEAPLENATVLVRDGRIEAVGADLALPFDARAVDVSGLTLTHAFVDALQQRALDFPERTDVQGRPYDTARDVLPGMPEGYRRGLRPERSAAAALPPDAADDPARRADGFAAVLVAPTGELLSGSAALLALSGRPPREATLDPAAAQTCSLLWRTGPENYQGEDYPATLMGVMAHLRQALLDAERHALLADRHAQDDQPWRAAEDPALDALVPVIRGEQWLLVQAAEEEDIRLALGLRRDFPGLRVAIAGGLEAWKLADELAAQGVPVIHALDFGKEPEDPDAPPDDDEGTAAEADATAEPPSAAAPAAAAPPWDPQLPERLRRDRHERWLRHVRGVAALSAAGVTLAFGSFGRSSEDFSDDLRKALEDGGLTPDAALAALTYGPRAIFGTRAPRGEVAPGAPALLTAWEGQPLAKDGKARVIVADGVLFDLRVDSPPDEDEDEDEEKDSKDDASEARDAAAGDTSASGATADDAPVATWPVELDSDREPGFRTGGNVLIRGATLLTVSHGTLENHDLLVRDGRIAAIGPALVAPDGVRVMEAAGQFLMPGIIDCHSHTAIRGGINEWTRVLTPECTIEDEIDPEDVNLYRALAGGVTSARLLHGSSNAIGGRHEIIKFRWGKSAPELVFEGAPRGVKFALGENPRHSNGGSAARFPRTRMGVEAVLRRALQAGRDYAATWATHTARVAAGENPDPPRRDLRLEALAGILDGSIGVHSHCYQADEMLMLLRVAEDYGVQVQTLQHVLEGYKVAAEIAAHGAGGSLFVDWWAYKFEVYDATPYCAALMHEAGVLMSVNSDSDEHLRRLYLEAAKVCKYGGVPEEQALAMVTLNPARQLGIDGRVGSLDIGKDADLALFSLHPFDVRTQCLMTFVDGELYFQRRADRYDAYARDVARRIEDGRAARAAAGPAAELPPLAARSRQVDPAALQALKLPREATRAPSTPARPAGPALALVGGTVHTLERDGDEFVVHAPGVVLMEGGLIRGVYAGDGAPPAGYEVVDVTGRHVWPGLIDAGSSLGLTEIDTVAGTVDTREIGQDQPDLRASVAWHADSEHIAVARVNGTTTALVVPEGGRIAGQSSALALEGWTANEALVKDAVALHVVAPRTPRKPKEAPDEEPDAGRAGHHDQCAGGPVRDPWTAAGDEPSDAEPKEEDRPLPERLHENWKDLRRLFTEAREYARVSGEASRLGVPGPDPDPRLQALAPYALGQAPVVFEADWADQIMDALDFARDAGLVPIIAGGQQAWRVADRLALDDVPVILGPVLALPLEREDLYDAPLQNAAALHAAGVRLCFRSNSSSSARDLPYHAGMAVAFGLDEDTALHALTAGAAEILGIADAVGVLSPGRRADIIVTDGSPLQIRTALTHLYIGGRDVGLQSRHTRLYEKYRGRLLDPGRPNR